MHIVHYFPGLVPPVGYGGVERMVYWLTREQARRGQRVTVLAQAGSSVGERVPVAELVPIAPDCGDIRPYIPSDADVVHFHATPDRDRLPDRPFLATEQGNRNHFRAYAPNTVFVSRRHAENHGSEHFVYNGVPLDEFPLQHSKRKQMLYMAKLNWRAKNAKTAIHLSLDSGVPLMLGGGTLRDSRKVWGSWILRMPRRGGLIRQVGEVDGVPKLELLRDSSVLFFLVNWEEPFGIACQEALACGTPVLATPNGALPEQIRDGENGFLVRDYRQALDALERLCARNESETAQMAEACRASAMSIESSADRYQAYYERVIAGESLYSAEQLSRLEFRRPASVRIERPVWLSR